MTGEPWLTTHQKALRLNLDGHAYGTLAEIGAGQEVSRWFFRAGHAAGTIAKTISAYDMAVSDAIYGRAERYVSRHRLESMLIYEFDLLVERLDVQRGGDTRFFAFADTVATRRRGRDEAGRGWMGVRFQGYPRQAPSEILVHVTMQDRERVHEQEAVGILGVNLVYAAFYMNDNPTGLIDSLVDGLSRDRIVVDVVRFSGPVFDDVDNRLMSLELVQHGLSDAALFTGIGEVIEPSEILYNRPVIIQRGHFRPIHKLNLDLIEKARRQFKAEPECGGEEPVILLEMTQRELGAGDDRAAHEDFLARVDLLGALGFTVLVSRFRRYFRLVEYLSRYTRKPIRIALGVPVLMDFSRDDYFTDLEGGALEAFGRFFRRNVRVYAYPFLDRDSGTLVTAESLRVNDSLQCLFSFLLGQRALEGIRDADPACFGIHSEEVLASIQSGDPAWEAQVPAAVVRLVKERRLFGWKPS